MRLQRDDRFMLAALAQATGGTCARRRVGCVLVDARGLQLSSGFNGPAAGQRHCVEVPCGGAGLPSGTGLDACEAVHAEQNALMQCRDVWQVDACYTTTAPCLHCIKMLMNTSCRRIVYLEDYPHTGARDLWQDSWPAVFDVLPQGTWTRPVRQWVEYVPSSPQADKIVKAFHAHVVQVLG